MRYTGFIVGRMSSIYITWTTSYHGYEKRCQFTSRARVVFFFLTFFDLGFWLILLWYSFYYGIDCEEKFEINFPYLLDD